MCCELLATHLQVWISAHDKECPAFLDTFQPQKQARVHHIDLGKEGDPRPLVKRNFGSNGHSVYGVWEHIVASASAPPLLLFHAHNPLLRMQMGAHNITTFYPTVDNTRILGAAAIQFVRNLFCAPRQQEPLTLAV